MDGMTPGTGGGEWMAAVVGAAGDGEDEDRGRVYKRAGSTT